ncbi:MULTISPECIES: hypothetical protein [unclassified Streptomyces]|uniref:hypothetical protein n=1 Tax=unclassified Streptomyces TaxID=2593676 RepID=UPI00380525C7
MKFSMRRRAKTVMIVAAVMTTATMTIGSGTASAAIPNNVRFMDTGMQGDGSRSMAIYVNGTLSGTAYWKANGDTLQAVDPHSDGWGIYTYLGTSPVREVTTYGHKAPYTATKGGNLPEDKKYTWWACIGSDTGGLVCSDLYNVTS